MPGMFSWKLNQPFGMLVMGAHFYVGNTGWRDAVPLRRRPNEDKC